MSYFILFYTYAVSLGLAVWELGNSAIFKYIPAAEYSIVVQECVFFSKFIFIMPCYMLTALSKLLFGSELGNSSAIF